MQNGRIVQTGTAEDIVLAPADDYVAEFVRHMNPLNVLTGGMIMRSRRHMVQDGKALWLDEARRYRAVLGEGDLLMELRIDGALSDTNPPLALAPADLSLQEIIHLRQGSGHPVLLMEDGRLVGVCGEIEIIRALAGAHKRPAASSAAN